jgi:hypothetical protein
VSGAGGLLVAAIGVNLLLAGLGLEERRVRVGAMLPGARDRAGAPPARGGPRWMSGGRPVRGTGAREVVS